MATCVGEEGLDIGEVDLIVCFDAAKSPIRLVQRMGRTGRKRDGRIIVMVTEGKEDQIYNKSQSNKRSIHRAIKEGCKNLTFFNQCPRMVPRYVSPQVHKMHMTIGEFVSSRPGRKGASAKTGGGGGRSGKVSGSSGQAKLGFAASKRKGGRGGFLSNDELVCWNNELALCDKESRTLVRSVEQCFPTQTEFLSIAKLKGNAAKSKPGYKNNCSFVDLSTSFGNSSLNSSSTSQLRKKYRLSLNRWTHCQNAPIPTKMTGHSSKTQQLSSALEFIDLLNSGDGVGQSYDLEMETFLNHNDILTSSGSQEARNTKGGKSDIQEKKRKSRKILDDLSDEDDFQSKMPPGDKDNTAESASPEPAKVHVDEIVTVEDTEQLNYDDPGDQIDSDRELDCDIPVEEAASVNKEPVPEDEEEETAFTAYTASQHVVPQAPSLDSLDWLDEMEPSQMPPSLVNKDRNMPKPLEEVLCTESVSRKGEEFQFVTPKAPPSSRRSRIQASSTPISSAGSSRKIVTPPSDDGLFQESVELFDDLPENEILDNFSDTSFLSSSTTNRKPKVSECIHPVGPVKSTCTNDNQRKRNIHETSDDCVIIDSDPEQEKEEESREKERGHKSLPNVHESPYASDDSFLQIHGQRRKRACRAINHLLESPSTQQAEMTVSVKVFADVSPGSKENAGTLGGGVKKSGSTGEWLSSRQPRCKDVKKVTRFNLSNSSDEEDFDVPLMQRIRNKSKTARQESSDHTSRSSVTDLSRKEREQRVRPRRRKLIDGFVEEEAEVSSGEGDGSEPPSQEQQKHMQDSNEYDMEDSFINDNSMLTQVSPSQRERVQSKSSRALTSTSDGCSSGNMYLQSLMSPEDRLFGGRKKGKVGGGNQYRMVFSQRHQILNHYIKKAGFNVDDEYVDGGGGARRGRKRHRRKRIESDDEECDSYSEAEEKIFRYGEEDLAEFSQSRGLAADGRDGDMLTECSDSRTTCSSSVLSVHGQSSELITDDGDDRTPVSVSRNRKRRPKFLSDSDCDTSSPADHKNTSASKRLRLSSSPSPNKKETAANIATSSATGGRQRPWGERSATSTTFDRVVVSPSLLVSNCA